MFFAFFSIFYNVKVNPTCFIYYVLVYCALSQMAHNTYIKKNEKIVDFFPIL